MGLPSFRIWKDESIGNLSPSAIMANLFEIVRNASSD